ncbi:hypothetical protein [Oceanicoccus sagamiensis]|uniref:hypothetical protein n=1 Tax=Oceanicoccus sagamiensis TaxID=716816 RepID=UPI000A271AC0|nr:hypothetical protein [Oceanicoccus sagamiensis]
MAVGDSLYQDKYKALSSAISNRVWADKDLVSSLKRLGVDKDSFELADIGNALADFIAVKFSCPPSRWQSFLKGDKGALSTIEKKGAVAFFGKGRCAVCHTPPLFSDFKFHSIGVPQGDFGPHTRTRDLGRAGVTNKADDLYLFRTPPLIAVKDTAPYGHNGVFSTLESVVVHHVNPVQLFLDKPELMEGNDRYRLGRYLDARSELLRAIEVFSDDDLKSIISFLEAI